MKTVVLYNSDDGQEFVMDFSTRRPVLYADTEAAKKGLKKLGWKEADFDQLEFLEIKGVCPRCGFPVVRSDLEDYDFQCVNCDEDFYRFEVRGCLA